MGISRQMDKRHLVQIISKNFRRIVMIIFILFSLWNAYESLQKYFYSNMSTKVNMVSSTDTIPAAIIVCPAFPFYKKEKMQQYGLTLELYKESNIQGNTSSIDERRLFDAITHNYTEIVDDIEVLYKSGKKIRHFVLKTKLKLIYFSYNKLEKVR